MVGALGYSRAGRRSPSRSATARPTFDTIAITAFSGGSQAGLLMARQLAGLRAEVVGIPIAWEGERVRAYVSATSSTRRAGAAGSR